MRNLPIFALIVVAQLAPAAHAQGVRAQPYNGQLRTDPAVGNVQGIQRYGRPLKTDPDQGEGYSYHVYPVAQDPTVIVAPGLLPGGAALQGLAGRSPADVGGLLARAVAEDKDSKDIERRE